MNRRVRGREGSTFSSPQEGTTSTAYVSREKAEGRREVKERGGEDEKRCGSPNPAGRDRRGKEGKEEE